MWEKNQVPGSASGGPARYKWAGKGLPMGRVACKEGFAARNCFARAVVGGTLSELQPTAYGYG